MPRTPTTQVDEKALYEAALEGLELQRQRIDDQIAAVRALLGGRAPRTSAASAPAPAPVAAESATEAGRKKRGRPRKRNLSPEARKRIAEAQKKRWAQFRKEQGPNS